MDFLRKREQGRIATTNVTNEIVDAISADGDTARGSVEQNRRPLPIRAVIWDEGPDEEADYEDQRYWVRTTITAANGDDDTDSIAIPTIKTLADADEELWVTAENLAEHPAVLSSSGNYFAGPHSLPKGLPVYLYCQEDISGFIRWTFNQTSPTFFAELTDTGDDDGWYSWSQVLPDPTASDGWKDPDDPLTGDGTAMEANLTTGLPVTGGGKRGRIVRLQYIGQKGSYPAFVFVAGGQPGLFPVNLTDDGGGGTPLTYTYTVKTIDDSVTLGVTMTPLYRPIAADGTAATKGVGYMDGGTFVLWMTNEKYSVQSCNPS